MRPWVLEAWLVLALGSSLGFLTLSSWPAYRDYALWDPGNAGLYGAALLVGALLALGFRELSWALAAAGAVGLLAVLVPVGASAVTSHLLGTTSLLDVIMFAAIRQAIFRWLSLLVFSLFGLVLGLILRDRR